MIGFAQFGAGRIGAIHAGNIARHRGARLIHVVDVNRVAAERLAASTARPWQPARRHSPIPRSMPC